MRQQFKSLCGGIASVAAAAIFTTGSFAQPTPAKPKEPLTISVIDVAGDLQISQPAIEKFRMDHPELSRSP
jgi:putative spermidine/putrescine transport system substrate-binding protein